MYFWQFCGAAFIGKFLFSSKTVSSSQPKTLFSRVRRMAKYTLKEFEEVRKALNALPNRKICGVLTALSQMKKSKTCSYSPSLILFIMQSRHGLLRIVAAFWLPVFCTSLLAREVYTLQTC